jgi:oxalate decarboxylase/phosphoglucose isomerase-like protein (cupin superfamily)
VVERAQYAYENWIESTGLPIHKGYYIEDVREIELGRWEERDCNAAFLMLEGQQNVSEARVTEIAPGKTLPPLKFALDEIVYVVEGQGICTVWQDGGEKRSFEWQKHSMFLLPRNHHHQLSNARGNQRALLLHNNYLPVAMAGAPDIELFFDNAGMRGHSIDPQNFYSEAKMVEESDAKVAAKRKAFWRGNFFPDMRAWDKLVAFRQRGAGGKTIFIDFPGSNMSCHMSVFDAGTYKKGHRHGPSYVIVIPAGEGYSIMWPEGGDKVIVPWREASVFVPPDNWYHQHFNVGETPARYLALHPPRPFSKSGNPSNQIEYPSEEPFIRQKFETELGKRGLRSRMPAEAYADKTYEWAYAEG